ncbi:MAG: MBL fold metallo-hydrolase, partial [Pseudomonadota bacterium]
VYFIEGQDEMIPDAHVYVIGLPGSGDLSLVDAGLTGKGAYKCGALKNLGFDLESVKRVIMTHTHMDHIGCLAELREQMPWAELWVHIAEGDPLESGDERTVYGMDMFRQMCQAQYGLKTGDFTFKVDRKLEGGESLDIGDMAWEVIHIPGHSPGGIALYHKEKKILIPGDVLYADHAIGRFDLHGADASALKTSLMRLSEREVKILLPGHNRIVTDLPDGYISATLEQWGPYLS